MPPYLDAPFARPAIAPSSAPSPADLVEDYYKPCACMGKAPGRGCRICFDQLWLKRCRACLGLGLVSKIRIGTERKDRCGPCMGSGWMPCPRVEISVAEAQWDQDSEEIGRIGLITEATEEVVEGETPAPVHRVQRRGKKAARKRKPVVPAIPDSFFAIPPASALMSDSEPEPDLDPDPDPDLPAA